MAGTNTFLSDATIRHSVFVQRFAGGELKKINKVLFGARDKVIRELSVLTDTTNRARLTATLIEIEGVLDASYAEIGESIRGGVRDFTASEVDFNVNLYTKGTKATFASPSLAVVEAAAFATPIETLSGRGLVIDQALTEFSRVKRSEVIQTINSGAIAGKSIQDISKDIRFQMGNVQKNHAEALTRTIISHVSDEASQQVFAENREILDGVRWISTLDGNTTETCAALDQEVFPVGEGPRPPLHFGCRSRVVAEVKREYSLLSGITTQGRPAKGAGGDKANVRTGTKYGSWLKGQPASFQDEVLGASKGRLFRSGGMDVTEFVDSNYKPLTLDELRLTNPLAFEQAGLI